MARVSQSAGSGHRDPPASAGRHPGGVQFPDQAGHPGQLRLLGPREPRADRAAVPGHQHVAVAEQGQQTGRGHRPVERKAVRPVHRRAGLLDHVADQPRSRVGHVRQQVVVGVGAAEVDQLDGPVAEVEGVPVTDHLAGQVGGWGDDHFVPLIGGFLAAGDPPREQRPLDLVQMGRHPDVTVNRRVQVRARAEPLVAEAVIEVSVGVDHPADRHAAELPQVGTDLVGLPGR
jgi:hypothetical protein